MSDLPSIPTDQPEADAAERRQLATIPHAARDDGARQAITSIAQEVRAQSATLNAMAGLTNVAPAVRFAQELAAQLGVDFDASDAAYQALRDACTQGFSVNEQAHHLDNLFGRVAMALNSAGNLRSDFLVDVCGAFATLRTELKLQNPQEIVDRVRRLVLAEQELKREQEQHERCRVQLAGCGAVALGYGGDVKEGDYGWCASTGDVQRLFDDRQRLQAELDKIKAKFVDEEETQA